MRSITRVCLAILLVLWVPAAALANPNPAGSQASPVGFVQRFTNDLYVFGTAQCDTSEPVTVFADVLQGTTERSREITINCSPTPRFWVIRLANDGNGLYSQGPATLAISFTAGSGVFGHEQPIFLVRF